MYETDFFIFDNDVIFRQPFSGANKNFTLQQTRTGTAFGAARPVGAAQGGIFARCP
jgi:hypothetical protein